MMGATQSSALQIEDFASQPIWVESNTVFGTTASVDVANLRWDLRNTPTILTSLSTFEVETNLMIGPSRVGAFAVSSFGSCLFLPDPNLPSNVWVGPIYQAVFNSSGRAIGIFNFDSGIAENLMSDLPKVQITPFVSELEVFGLIPAGERLKFLLPAPARSTDLLTYYSGWTTSAEQQDQSSNLGPIAFASRLAKSILAQQKKTVLEDEAIEIAQRSVNDACVFVERELPDAAPSVMLSDDGVLMLQWRNADQGVLLIFTGDGTGSVSIKLRGGIYSVPGDDFSIDDKLPASAQDAIAGIVNP